MAVAEINSLTIERGTDFEATFKILEADSSPVTLSYYTGVSKIRKYPSSPTYHSFTVGITTATGEVNISMGQTTTRLLTPGRNYFDIIIISPDISDNVTTKVVEGTIIVSESIY
jgi:hypothetical protein